MLCSCAGKEQKQTLTDYVNPLLGTATLWETKDLGYERHQEKRTWGAEAFPGAALPNAMSLPSSSASHLLFTSKFTCSFSVSPFLKLLK